MKKLIVAFFASLLALSFATATFANPNEIIGVWETEKKDGIFKFYKAGNHYQAKLIYGADFIEKDGKTSKKDVNNRDPKLRNQNVIGLTNVIGLVYKDGKYTDGKIYDANSGRWYNCRIEIKKGKMHLRGFLGVALLGQTTIFNKK